MALLIFQYWAECRQKQMCHLCGRLSFYNEAQLAYTPYKPSPIRQFSRIGAGLFRVIECAGFYRRLIQNQHPLTPTRT